MRVLAIDPGNAESGWCVIDADTRRPLEFGKDDNDDLLDWCYDHDTFADVDLAVIEMIASYGMAVGKTVFETCVWIGRLSEALRRKGIEVELVYRRAVRDHHCDRNPKARDANVAQALKDRFAPGVRNHGKGTKADPGWFYGFRADVWQAYALAVYAADTPAPNTPREPRTTGYWESH